MIYLIITTCINNKAGIYDFEHRKNRYISCIQSVLTLIQNDETIKQIIVENNGVTNTYLNIFNCDVLYTNNNNLNLNHKGENELLDIKYVINQYNIQDNDIIIKLTGRYKMLDVSFFDLVKNNFHTYDAFIKFYNVCEHKYMHNDCVLGLYAMKCKYLKNFHYNFEKSPECEFAEYVRNNIKEKVMEVENLNLECCFANDFKTLHV